MYILANFNTFSRFWNSNFFNTFNIAWEPCINDR